MGIKQANGNKMAAKGKRRKKINIVSANEQNNNWLH